MLRRDKVWEWLERWHALFFLVAGGLLFATAAMDALNLFAGMALPSDIGGITGFGGLVLTFVGLLGLYPRLSDGAPRLAQIGVLLLSLPAIYFAVFLVKGVLTQFLDFPPLAYQIPALDVVTGAVFFLFAVGVSIFGGICLRTEVLSRTIGILLILMAAPWFWLVGWLLLYGLSIQTWAVIVQFGTLAIASLNIGYRLRQNQIRSSVPTTRAAQSPEDTSMRS